MSWVEVDVFILRWCFSHPKQHFEVKTFSLCGTEIWSRDVLAQKKKKRWDQFLTKQNWVENQIVSISLFNFKWGDERSFYLCEASVTEAVEASSIHHIIGLGSSAVTIIRVRHKLQTLKWSLMQRICIISWYFSGFWVVSDRLGLNSASCQSSFKLNSQHIYVSEAPESSVTPALITVIMLEKSGFCRWKPTVTRWLSRR